jgi:hypothetical protein
MTTWQEAALEVRNEHVAAGLGEAEPLTALDRVAAKQLSDRLDRWIEEGRIGDGFAGRSTYNAKGRRPGYLR